MSKRYFPQQQGERKKAKLNISVSDHNFPLSQNSEFNKGEYHVWINIHNLLSYDIVLHFFKILRNILFP